MAMQLPVLDLESKNLLVTLPVNEVLDNDFLDLMDTSRLDDLLKAVKDSEVFYANNNVGSV